jgi:hypothetical protein
MWSEYGLDMPMTTMVKIAMAMNIGIKDVPRAFVPMRLIPYMGPSKQDIFSTLRVALNKCSQHFYINTFIARNGAGGLLNVTGRLKSLDEFYSGNGHDACSAVSNG